MYQNFVEIYKQLLSKKIKSPVSFTCFLVNQNEWVQCSNGFCEFDSHTTTIKYINMTIINKITGRDISTEYLGLLSGLITNDEFELITLTLK